MFIMPFCLRLLPRQLGHRQRKYHQTAAAAQPFPSTISIFHDFFSSRPFILNTTHDSARFSISYFLLHIKTRPVSREYLQKCKRKPCRARTYARNSALLPGCQRQAQAAGLCASLGLRLAFACGECPTGAPLASGPSTIVSAIGSGRPVGIRKRAPQGDSFSYGISRARTYARNSALSPGSQRQAQAAGLCASLCLRLAFACGECPTGAPLPSGPSTIVSAVGSGPLHERKDTHKGCLSFMGLVGLEPMTSTMSKPPFGSCQRQQPSGVFVNKHKHL